MNPKEHDDDHQRTDRPPRGSRRPGWRRRGEADDQQNWPFENEITGLASGEEINDACDGDDDDTDEDAVVFIVEGQQRCYGSKRAWNIAH